MGWGLRNKLRRAAAEARYLWANTVGRPMLYRTGTPERLGVIYRQPSDMCTSDRVMLYALIRGLRPTRVLEIGVRWGGGARIIAAALEDANESGRAVGIDPEPEAFRVSPRELFGRYELLRGSSPEAIPEAVAKLGGQLDLAIIDAMHTHRHALADFRGVVPYMAAGGHVLLHDTFHQGIDRAVAEMLTENPDFVDCGFLTRHPDISDAPVAYQGLRLIRLGTPDSREMIAGAFQHSGRPVPEFSLALLNWDHYWNEHSDEARGGKHVLVEQPTGGHQERHIDLNDAQALQKGVIDAGNRKL
jgi:cephalosporin hydroxylase